jgi:hypothetical protein
MKKLLLILLFSSCISQKKLAEKCIEQFPCDTTIVTIDTTLVSDTQYINTEYHDTIIVRQFKTITEVKYLESTAKLYLEKEKHKSEINAIKQFDLDQILDLNRMMDKMALDTTNKAKEINNLKEENQKLKQRLSTANKYKWGVYLFAVVLLFIAFLKWFKP